MKRILLLSLFCLSTHAFAQSSESETPSYGKWIWGGSVGLLNIDQSAAAEEFIDDKATAIDLFAEYSKQRWLTTLGLDFVMYDDNAGFRQRTEDYYGNTQNSSSSATAFGLSAAFGPQWTFGGAEKTKVYVQGGLEHLLSSERSIGNCTDCYSEDIDISGGAFAKAGVRFNVGAVAIGFSYQQFLGAELDNSFRFVISSKH